MRSTMISSTRKRKPVPSYRLHKPSGQAVVTLSGKDHYLGPYGTEVSKAEYDRLIAEWLANGRSLKQSTDDQPNLTVNEIILQYWTFAKSYYVKKGQPTSEQSNIKSALKVIRRLYGATFAADFSPLSLKAVRNEYLADGLCRATVNRYTSHIKRMFKWAVENELVPVEVLQALQAVSGLKKGRCEANDPDPIRPVPESSIEAIRPFVSKQVWAMIQLQLHTGMRPGEVVAMRTGDLVMKPNDWAYWPASHKNEHRDQSREVLFGPKAQEIVQQWLKTDLSAFLFSPEEAEQERNASRVKTNSRRVKKTHSQHKRSPGKCYTTASYRRAIQRACEIAFEMPENLRNIPRPLQGVPEVDQDRVRDDLQRQAAEWRKLHCWHPNQLRHNAATEYQKQYGWIVAKALCGHANADTTRIYAEMDRKLLLEAVNECG